MDYDEVCHPKIKKKNTNYKSTGCLIFDEGKKKT